MELLINETIGYEALLPWTDIRDTINKNAHGRCRMMAFQSPKDILCYQVMLFGLINGGATYQTVMTTNRMLEDTVECYVYDFVVKSR